MSNTAFVEKLPRCDLCGDEAHFDARTVSGPWANLCDLCFGQYGVGLGTGLGQMLKVREDVVEVSVSGEVTQFDRWMLDVDYALEKAVGVCTGDLPDVPYYDWYERGIIASDAAESAVERAMNW